MGLNICRSIIEFHNGRLLVDAEPRRRYHIHRLPCRRRQPVSAMPAAPDQIVHVVDDDEALRDSLAWMLEANGYAVAAHESGEAFLRRVHARHDRLHRARRAHAGHERAGAVRGARPPALRPAGGLHHRPRRRADGGVGAQEGRGGFHREALRRARHAAPGRTVPAARARDPRQTPARGRHRAPHGAAHPARARGARPHHRRQAQQADRRRARHQHQDGGGAPRARDGEDGRAFAGRARRSTWSRSSPAPPRADPGARHCAP